MLAAAGIVVGNEHGVFIFGACFDQSLQRGVHGLLRQLVVVALHLFKTIGEEREVELRELVVVALERLETMEVAQAREVGNAHVADVDVNVLIGFAVVEDVVVVGVEGALDILSEDVIGEVGRVDGDIATGIHAQAVDPPVVVV